MQNKKLTPYFMENHPDMHLIGKKIACGLKKDNCITFTTEETINSQYSLEMRITFIS